MGERVGLCEATKDRKGMHRHNAIRTTLLIKAGGTDLQSSIKGVLLYLWKPQSVTYLQPQTYYILSLLILSSKMQN